jgi:hypothetical protein
LSITRLSRKRFLQAVTRPLNPLLENSPGNIRWGIICSLRELDVFQDTFADRLESGLVRLARPGHKALSKQAKRFQPVSIHFSKVDINHLSRPQFCSGLWRLSDNTAAFTPGFNLHAEPSARARRIANTTPT